ncbi:hypothetical protein IEQ34_008851 [Dendrobium chrysotoxum]|uniref:Uncharacterized protein n=1 Tax=Dendrobium chrysotoxum TaxID=161865 RepID=A0AAV7GX45_DENCH|nr:hypothetical protein IEQ34_008851 [Dendrobium chrysotoxum]
MSFLAGRLAAKEGSFFLQESKLAAGRLAEKLPPSSSGELDTNSSAAVIKEPANVLPEILRHSIPIKAKTTEVAEPSLSTASKWLLKDTFPSSSSSTSPDGLNPLRAYVSIPQATFGPRRWELPNEQPTFFASTANELRRDRPPINPEKLKAFARGYSQIGKAFAVATVIVFGGATALLVYTARKLQIESVELIAFLAIIEEWMLDKDGIIIKGDNNSIIKWLQLTMTNLMGLVQDCIEHDHTFLTAFKQVFFHYIPRQSNL